MKDAERRLRWLAAVVIFNVVLSTSYQDALFLAYHEKPAIPPAMLLGNLLTALTTLGLNRLLRKRPAAGALRIILLALGLITLGAAVWNLRPNPVSTFVLFLFIEVATTVGVAATWTYFQAPLEASQIRWLLPRLGTWSGIGGLLAGSVVPIILRKVNHPQWLLWLSAVAWFLAAVLVRTDYAARAPAKRRSGSGQESNLQQLVTIPLVRWMVIGTAGIIWTGLLIQYETRVALRSAWDPGRIALVMSILLATTSVGGIATQAWVTTPVLDRWGVGLALAILPISVGSCLSLYFYATTTAHWPTNISVWIIVAALMIDKTLRPNLHRPAESCLVAALSPAIRPTLLLVLGGIMQPLIKAVGALLLWASAAAVGSHHLTGAAVVMAIGVTILSMRWGALYARTLRETLEEGSVDAIGSADANEDLIPMIDGPRLRVLLEAIDTGSQRSRELALELLRSHRSNLVAKAMQARIRHPFEPVRIAALRWLADEPNPELETHLKQRWQERNISDKERVALLQAAGPLGAMLIGEDTGRWVSAPNPALRSAAIAAMLAPKDPRHQKVARRALEAMLNSRDPDEVIAALRLVQEHKVAEFLPLVLARLSDGDIAVRREALSCLPSFSDERARLPLWDALSEPPLAHVGVRALTSIGEPIVPSILGYLGRQDLSSQVRLHLLRALGMIASASSIATLLEHLSVTDRGAQLEALKSLNKIRRANEVVPINQDTLNTYLLQELRWGLHMLRARDLLREQLKERMRSSSLIGRELEAQIDAAQQRVALTLALLSPKDTMVHIFKALRAPNSPHRDQARELLRALFKPGPVVSASLKLLDDSQPWSGEFFLPPLSVATGQSPETAVEWLKLTMDPWIVSALKHDPDCPKSPTPFPEIDDPLEKQLDVVLFLKDVALFEALTNGQLVEIGALAEKVDLPAGQLLFDQGDVPDYLYLVRKGKLRILSSGQEVARLGPGECVGEMAVLAGTRRTAGVDTLEPCQLLRFSSKDFLGLVDVYPEIGRALLKSMVRRLASSSGRGTKQDKRASTIVGMVWGKDGPRDSTASGAMPVVASGEYAAGRSSSGNTRPVPAERSSPSLTGLSKPPVDGGSDPGAPPAADGKRGPASRSSSKPSGTSSGGQGGQGSKS
ncbi:MAG: cyclic nucleotide-binding domain-containing protein [Polyangia bacterium]